MATVSKSFCTTPDCGEPLPDHGTLCYGCTAKLISALKSVPELMDDLAITFTKRSKTVQASGPGAGEMDPVRFPYNLGASKAKAELHGILRSWVSLVSEERVITTIVIRDGKEQRTEAKTAVTCPDTPTALSGWLLQYTGWLRHHPAGADAVMEIREKVANARRVIDVPAEKIYIGPCGTDRCMGQLWTLPDATDAVCRECGHKWDVRQRRDANLSALRDTVDYPEPLARALTYHGRPMTAGLIYQWRSRGLLEPYGVHRTTRRSMYQMGDVIDLLDRLREGKGKL
jgi:hypothetical protein